jgi:hypothetical protein
MGVLASMIIASLQVIVMMIFFAKATNLCISRLAQQLDETP